MKTSEKKLKKEATLFVHTLDHEGRGLARDEENRVVIIENALLESKVLVEIDREKKNLAFAHVVKVLEKSPHEVEPKCMNAQACGGCTWQQFDYNEQIKAKKKIVIDAFSKIAKYELNENFTINKAENLFNYRNKMEFSFGFTEESAEEVLGLKAKASNSCLEVNCHLCTPVVNRIIHRLQKLCFDAGLEVFYTEHKEARGFLRSVITRINEDNSSLLIEIITYPRPDFNQTLYTVCRTLKEEFPNITGIIHSTRKNLLPLAYGEKAIAQFGSKEMHENLQIASEKLAFSYGYQSFFQTNTKEASKLYSKAFELVKSLKINKIADIYCGVGGVGLSIAHAFKKQGQKIKLLGLEINKQACTYATKNAEKLQIDAEFTLGDAKSLSKFLKANKGLELIILDPPRAGIDKESILSLLKAKIENILIISCNPATLARDFAQLQQNYEVQEICSFDLFPHTPHIESLMLLKLKK